MNKFISRKGSNRTIGQLTAVLLVFLLVLTSLFGFTVSAEETWSAVRGYSGDAGSVTFANGVTSLKGFGGASYSGSSSTGMAAEFQIVSYPASGYWFSFGLVSKAGAFWKPDGTESLGLVTTFTVTSTGISASVIKITTSGMTALGTITSNTGTTNVTHTFAFYLENGSWNVVLDGRNKITAAQADVPLESTQYFCAGANSDPTMEMKILKTYADSAIPATCKYSASSSSSVNSGSTSSSTATSSAVSQPASVNPGNPDKSLNYFNIVRGYSGTTGSAGFANSRYVLTGYGGVSYKKPIQNEIAMEFKLDSIPDTSYWFCVGLVNKPNVFWKDDGSESLGMILTVTANFDNELVVQVRQLSVSGYTILSTIKTTKDAVNSDHILAIYRQDNKWMISLDNLSQASVEADKLDLKDTSYLVVGANGTNTMAMSFSKLYLDGEVTDEFKTVNVTKQKDLITYTEDGALKIGDVVQGGALQYYGSNNLLTSFGKEIPLVTVILAGLAALAIILSAVFFIISGRKTRKPKNQTIIEEEQL